MEDETQTRTIDFDKLSEDEVLQILQKWQPSLYSKIQELWGSHLKLQQQQANQEVKSQVQIAEVIVSSQREGLKEVEKCANRLLKKHEGYLKFRREMQLRGAGYFG